MSAEDTLKNAHYYVMVLRLLRMRAKGEITADEYRHAKNYYKNITGAIMEIAE